MEHTDWIYQGIDAAQARFLMVTAITHHRFSSPIWGEHEVRKVHGELEEIEIAAARIVVPPASATAPHPAVHPHHPAVHQQGVITTRTRFAAALAECLAGNAVRMHRAGPARPPRDGHKPRRSLVVD
jgi:hypothetical protein